MHRHPLHCIFWKIMMRAFGPVRFALYNSLKQRIKIIIFLLDFFAIYTKIQIRCQT